MARDLDVQLLESVRVRRQRLRDAFLHGRLRTRRSAVDNVRRVLFSAVAAAIICAGCAGISFAHQHLHDGNGLAGPVPASSLSNGAP